jgi:hypothetical protein
MKLLLALFEQFLSLLKTSHNSRAQQSVQRTRVGFTLPSRDSAPLAGSPFGIFPPNPALAANACRSAAA